MASLDEADMNQDQDIAIGQLTTGLPVVVRAVRPMGGQPRLVLGNVAEREVGDREEVLFYGDVSVLNESQQFLIMTAQVYSTTSEQRRGNRVLRLRRFGPGMYGPELPPLIPIDQDRGENGAMVPQHGHQVPLRNPAVAPTDIADGNVSRPPTEHYTNLN